MANYAVLKEAIDNAIKANGQREITGDIMNQVLTAMVNSLGDNYQFAGVATPTTNPGQPDQNVFYMATQAGTYTNFSAIVLQAGISILLWDGSWSSETFFTIDSVPTSESTNLITSGAVFERFKLDGGAYDVSVHNNGATFASLSALLNNENINTLIPVAVRHGGMSIKFLQSSDNKYVQYRYIGTAVTGDPNPFLDTANWVVYGDINPIEQELQIIQEAIDAQNSYERLLSNTGSVDVSTYGWVMAWNGGSPIPVGEKILYTVKSNGATGTFKVVVGLAGQAQGEILYEGEILDGETKSFEYVTEEVSYGLMVQSRDGGTGTTTLDLTVDKYEGVTSNLDNAVLYTSQTKTDAQKQQARQNIGLGDGTIDDEPTAGSNNLVKSGGVQNKLNDIKEDQDQLSGTVEIMQSALNAEDNVETITSQDVSLAAGGYTYGFVDIHADIPQGTPMRYIITNDANGTAGVFKITLLLAGQAQGHLLAEEYIGLGETKVYDYITDELSYGLFIQTRTPDMNATTIHAVLQKNHGTTSNLDSKLSEEFGNNIISSITYGHALRGSDAVEDTGLDVTRYAVTDYIPFGDNNSITCNACITSNVGYKYALYGQDKELISVGAPETNLATINKTDGVEYIRFSIDVMVNLPFACYGTELKEYDDYSKVGGYLPKKIFYCGQNREITTLKQGIEIAERTMDSILYVDEGTYDLIEEFGSDYFANATATNNHIGLVLKNRIHIIFSPNSKVVCNYTGDNEYICTLFSPFNAGEFGFTIENLTLEASRTRYAVHDERNSRHDQHISHYINCDFYFDNSQNIPWDKKASVIGGGLGSNTEIVIERCRFRSISDAGITTTGIYYHQAESAAARGEAFKSVIRILDNYLEDCRIIFQFNYEYQNAPTVVFVNGNSVPSAGSSGKGYDTTGTAFTYNIIRAWNNDIRN